MVESELTIIPRMRRIFKDTKANLDALTNLKDEDMGYATDEKQLYRQNGDGAANWEQITYYVQITSGTYTGDGNDNRQITCGFVPKVVFLITDDLGGTPAARAWITMSSSGAWDAYGNAFSADCKLHATDGFEVDAANANLSSKTYRWTAFI